MNQKLIDRIASINTTISSINTPVDDQRRTIAELERMFMEHFPEDLKPAQATAREGAETTGLGLRERDRVDRIEHLSEAFSPTMLYELFKAFENKAFAEILKVILAFHGVPPDRIPTRLGTIYPWLPDRAEALTQATLFVERQISGKRLAKIRHAPRALVIEFVMKKYDARKWKSPRMAGITLAPEVIEFAQACGYRPLTSAEKSPSTIASWIRDELRKRRAITESRA